MITKPMQKILNLYAEIEELQAKMHTLSDLCKAYIDDNWDREGLEHNNQECDCYRDAEENYCDFGKNGYCNFALYDSGDITAIEYMKNVWAIYDK